MQPSPALSPSARPAFTPPYAAPDEEVVAGLLADIGTVPAEVRARVDASAIRLINGIRARQSALGGVEDFLHAYSLSTKEGLAIMVLAEALLRVPDAATADRLIEDKLASAHFDGSRKAGDPLLVSASAWALGITTRIVQPGETPDGVVAGLVKRLGVPAVRTATRQAMRVMGHQFVLGETIKAALARARSMEDKGYRHSYDMLGEGARTMADAERYFASYAGAIDAIGRSAGRKALPDRPGISVKLSALHPRYEIVKLGRLRRELSGRLLDLARAAKAHDLNFTVDAEEADRLALSLDIIGQVAADPSLKGWDGFGLAIQAYQKRAGHVIDWVRDLATGLDRRFMVRLVKGAYWDTEVKRAQERGLADYPVFTRKSRPTSPIWPARRRCWRRDRGCSRSSPPTTRSRSPRSWRWPVRTRRASSSSGCTAWERRSTSRSPRPRAIPAGSTHPSAATATSSPISSAGFSKTAPTPPSWPASAIRTFRPPR
ncbi:Bifunctional protein PutA [Methylobrevis pamukkalensis]|uniref:Bifunctional protein PutA n=1 Tax=Methylobrevis pamukkalensis TaxID=1439726 RepID=A0A1E3GX54_9HYPH|nr:Bifunctional protein PutA [Methylobrevis pamukkalensis]